MRVTSTSQVNPQEWDALAVTLGGGYFHTHAEALCNAASGGGEPLFVKGLNQAGQCVGLLTGNLAMSRVWPFSRYCGYAMLQGLPATADGSEASQRAFMEALEAHLRDRGAFSIRVYSYDSPQSEQVLGGLGYRLTPRVEFLMDLTASVEELWSCLRGQRRTDIRKAEKLGVVTRVENTLEAYEQVYEFQAVSLRRHGVAKCEASEAVRRARLIRLQSGHIDVLVSYHEGKAVNASIFGTFNRRPYYLISGASELGYKVCGPAHLLWTAIRLYQDQGARCLNLGAALQGQDGVYKFKEGFGAQPASAPIGVKHISRIGSCLHRLRSVVSRLGEIKRSENKTEGAAVEGDGTRGA